MHAGTQRIEIPRLDSNISDEAKSYVSTPNKIDINAADIFRAKSFRKSVNVTIKYVMGFSCLKFYFGYLYMFYHSSVWQSACVHVSLCVCVVSVFCLRHSLLSPSAPNMLMWILNLRCRWYTINLLASLTATQLYLSVCMSSSFSLAFANTHAVMIPFHKQIHIAH